MPYYLKITQPTILKTDLTDSEAKTHSITPEAEPMHLLGLVQDDHPGYLRFTLADGKFIDSRNTWWALKADVSIVEDIERSPEVELISDLSRDKADRGPLIHLPGLGDVYLFDRVGNSRNFFWYELTRHGKRIPPTAQGTEGMIRIAEALQLGRDKVGKPFLMTSGYRPEHINRSVGGARRSRHTDPNCDAVDFYWEGASKFQMYDLFDPWWKGGLGIYGHNNILHADARGYYARWGRR